MILKLDLCKIENYKWFFCFTQKSKYLKKKKKFGNHVAYDF